MKGSARRANSEADSHQFPGAGGPVSLVGLVTAEHVVFRGASRSAAPDDVGPQRGSGTAPLPVGAATGLVEGNDVTASQVELGGNDGPVARDDLGDDHVTARQTDHRSSVEPRPCVEEA